MYPDSQTTQPSVARLPKTYLIPVAAFVGLMTLSLMGWYLAEQVSNRDLLGETEVTARQVSLRLEAWIDARVYLLNQLVNVVPPKQGGDTDLYIELADSIHREHSGFQAVNWIDENGVIQVVVPREGNEAALGRDLFRHPDPMVSATLQRAFRSSELEQSGTTELLQGGTGFAIYLPVRSNEGEILGFINGVFRAADLINSCLAEKEFRDRFYFEIVDSDGVRLASNSESQSIETQGITVTYPVRVRYAKWFLTMSPSLSYAEAKAVFGGWLFLPIGILVSSAIAILLRQSLMRSERLRISEGQFRSLFENSKDAIYLSTLDGEILNLNSATTRLFGFSLDELKEINTSELYDSVNDRDQLLKTLREQGFVSDYELRLRRKDGKKRICQINSVLAVVPYSKEPVIQGIIRDITEQRELEGKLFQSQKMEAIGRLAGGVAHDFNNLLTVIAGNTELALQDIPKDHPTYQELKEIEATSQRAAELVSQLMALGRKQVISPRLIDVNVILAQMQSMLKRIIGEDIDLELRLDKQLRCIFMDPSQFQQIILNLAVNARDAMTSGGSLKIESQNQGLEESDVVGASSSGDYVQIQVSDTGHGMDRQTLEKVFEPFFTTKDESKGTGLGLSTVYGIVEQNNGRILVNSLVDQGTVFTILLPAKESAGTALEEDVPKAPPSKGKEVIFVVEDETNVREMIVRSLGSYGYTIFEAGSPQDALAFFDNNSPSVHLLITDVVMPGMSGPAMVERILEDCPDLRVLFISGHPGDHFVKTGILKPGTAFMQKPFLPSKLALKVEEILQKTGDQSGLKMS